MQDKLTVYCWTKWARVTAKRRVYTLPLYKHEAAGLFWQTWWPTLAQFEVIV
jgi:hypothetical protein